SIPSSLFEGDMFFRYNKTLCSTVSAAASTKAKNCNFSLYERSNKCKKGISFSSSFLYFFIDNARQVTSVAASVKKGGFPWFVNSISPIIIGAFCWFTGEIVP